MLPNSATAVPLEVAMRQRGKIHLRADFMIVCARCYWYCSQTIDEWLSKKSDAIVGCIQDVVAELGS